MGKLVWSTSLFNYEQSLSFSLQNYTKTGPLPCRTKKKLVHFSAKLRAILGILLPELWARSKSHIFKQGCTKYCFARNQIDLRLLAPWFPVRNYLLQQLSMALRARIMSLVKFEAPVAPIRKLVSCPKRKNCIWDYGPATVALNMQNWLNLDTGNMDFVQPCL